MFEQGLSNELIEAVDSLSQNLTQWMPLIEERLISLVGQELTGINMSFCEPVLQSDLKNQKVLN